MSTGTKYGKTGAAKTAGKRLFFCKNGELQKGTPFCEL